jgi:hypothetical protein
MFALWIIVVDLCFIISGISAQQAVTDVQMVMPMLLFLIPPFKNFTKVGGK